MRVSGVGPSVCKDKEISGYSKVIAQVLGIIVPLHIYI